MRREATISLSALVLLMFLLISCCKKVSEPIVKTTVEPAITTAVSPVLWKEVNPAEVKVVGKQIPLPTQFKVFHLNTSKMKELLKATVIDTISKVKKTELIELPLPEGKLSTYKISETPVMGPALQAKYPEMRTYGGKSIDDPTATVKLDFMPGGFHAYLITPRGSIIIQPYSEGDIDNYLTYYKQYSSEVKKPFEIPADSIK